MHIAGLAEDLVFEVMVFEVRKRMAHVCLARGEGLFPDDLARTPDARHPLHIARGLAHQKLWPEGTGAQLGMGQPEVVHPFRHMVGELVPKREPHTAGPTVSSYHIDARKLRFLARVAGETR